MTHRPTIAGESDTQGCIAGAIAHAYYGEISPEMERNVRRRLPGEFLVILDTFLKKYVS